MSATALWNKVRKQWIKDNPPNHQGYWECAYCFKWIPKEELTIDHIVPKSNFRNYSERHDSKNLCACCWRCNSLKGSKH